MDVYSFSNYKEVIKARVKVIAKSGRVFNLQRLAAKIPLQNTYLSKVLNDEKAHLNEDQLFRICQILEFLPDEVDFLLLLRSFLISENHQRKSLLEAKLNRLRKSKDRAASLQDFGSRKLSQEMNYLFDPLCILVHVALFIPEFFKNPKKLSPLLGVTNAKLKMTLEKIRDAGFITVDENENITEVKEQQIHFGVDHPLMRVHQNLLRQKTSLHLRDLNENQKTSFMGTFSADDESFLQIGQKFRNFLKEVEQIVVKAPSKGVYQVSFDLFQWL